MYMSIDQYYELYKRGMFSNTSVWYKEVRNKNNQIVAYHEITCSRWSEKYVIRVDIVNGFDKMHYPLIGTWVKVFEDKNWANNYFKKISCGEYKKSKEIVNC